MQHNNAEVKTPPKKNSQASDFQFLNNAKY